MVAAAVVASAIAIFTLPILAGMPIVGVVPAAAAAILVVAYRESAFRWRSLLTLLLLVIMFIPIRRYVLPANLPFQLEPYRILVAVLVVIWIGSLLIDPRIRLRATGLEGPLLLFVAACLLSIIFNGSHVTTGAVDSNVLKSLTFLFSFVLVVYLISSVSRRFADVLFLCKVLVLGAAVIAVLAIIESRTKYNFFNHLHTFLPFLKWNGGNTQSLTRVGKFRALGPAEHPIALSAALAMVAPLAGYFAYTLRQRRWWIVMAAIVLGCLATVSRTGVVVLLVEAVVFFVLRPQQMRKVWPAVLPMLVAVHFALPGTLGTLRKSFFPKGGLIAQQQGTFDNGRFGAARLDPTFAQIKSSPLVGIGFGTRITGAFNPNANALTLDDQWLGTTLETGILGSFAWIWLLVRIVRRLGSQARHDLTERGWLITAITASILGYGVSMLTYDAFSFIQVTFFFYIFIALGTCLLPERSRAPVASTVSRFTVRNRRLSAGAFGVAFLLIAFALVLFAFFQGTSVSFLSLVLILLAIGAVYIEKSRDLASPAPMA